MKSKLRAFALSLLVFFAGAGVSDAIADPYVSLGDSSSVTGTYVSLLYSGFEEFQGFDETLGADEHVSLAQGGQVLSGLKSQQLPLALAEINAEDDAKAVTVGIGGNEGLGGCFQPTSTCAGFATGYEDMLAQLKSALALDPGEETFIVLSYFNPKNGLAEEADFDQRLLGPDLTATQCPNGTVAGLNDAIMQAASSQGVQVGDAFPSFKQHGQEYIGGDQIHPNAAGNKAIAEAFLNPLEPLDCPGPPDPTCETDPGLCPPPTCETDPALCPEDDTVAPRTSLISMKRKGKRSVVFRFRSSEAGSFRCSIDGRAFSRCRSPRTYRGLGRGRHVFRVRAVDEAGNFDPTPVRRVFRIRR